MPRADRLFALVQLLSQPIGKTRAELMRELEASERSLYRDLADLEARGVAIERDAGRYRLMNRNLVRTGVLTARERVLLSLALESPELASQPAFRDSMVTLRRKLARTDPMRVALALSGPDRSGPVTANISDSIEQAIEAGHAISIRDRKIAFTWPVKVDDAVG